MQLKELFAIKKPCHDCPFLEVNRDMLAPGRLEEIILSLHDNKAFHCHKTIEYDRDSKEDQLEHAKYCGGSLIYLEKCGNTNIPMRLGRLYSLYDPSTMVGHHLVIEPLGLDRYIPGKKDK